MASQTTVTLLDDLDGKKADETVSFGLDGVRYEIDLRKQNAAALRKAFAEFVEAARPVRVAAPIKAAPAARRVPAAVTAGRKEELAAIRAWAQDAKIEIASRGRISQDVFDAYQASLLG